MKITHIIAASLMLATTTALADNLVILHTNDTHSMMDPDAQGRGGFLQRQAIIDSVRSKEKNVILVDAGDMVQGTLYFSYFNGDVEYPLFNMAGYDIRVLGNHEFDNGLDEIAKYYKKSTSANLSANYDFDNTPVKGLFKPYVIKKVGNKKIGFIGLNVDPNSLIIKRNYEGMKFSDPIKVGVETARFLKEKKGCDLVVAVTHIGADKEEGKVNDYDLAGQSSDIDIIIGAHSHTTIFPGKEGEHPGIAKNINGRPVLVGQAGKYGKYLGYIKIDLDKLKNGTAEDYDYRLIPVTDRFDDSKINQKMKAFITPYKHVVDSVNNHVLAQSLQDLDSEDPQGGYANWNADFFRLYSQEKIDSMRNAGTNIPNVDFALANIGGIRQNMPKGDVTEGLMLASFPFTNHIVVARIKGQDFIDAMKVAAKIGGEPVSNELRITYDQDSNLVNVVLNGKPMDPDKDYIMATNDYLQWGNDYYITLANSELLWTDKEYVSGPLIRYIARQGDLGLPIAPDPNSRWIKITN